MLTILSFLLVLTILVTVHEIGHLVAAKWLGVRVETFAIGFGPRVAGMRRGGTDYVLRLIPLGGYVQLGETGPADSFCPGSATYAERPPFDKICVAGAGPLANFLLAVFLLILVSLFGTSTPVFMERSAAIGWVAPGSPAEKAGLTCRDTIVGVDGTPAATWREVTGLLPLYDKDIRIEIAREGATKYLTLSQASRINAGFFPEERVIVGKVMKGGPAEQAGLRTGDAILSANGRPVAAWAAFQQAAAGGKGMLRVGVERFGRTFAVDITPEIDRKTGKAFVGVSYSPQTATKKHAFPAAVKNGLFAAGAIVSDSVGTFRGLFSGSLSLRMLGGPVAIAEASGSIAREGLVPLLSFLAFLSVQLGIFNLLPFFPIVDGGQITIFLFEAIRRRPMGAVPLERLLKVGWAVMGLLILFVTYNDVMKLL